MSVTTLLLYAIITLTSLIVYYIRRRLNYWKEQGIPHDKPSLLRGNFQGVTQKYTFADITANSYRKFKDTGPFCGFYVFQRPAVLLLDIELIKNVLIKDFSNFTDRGMFHNERDDPLTGHLFLLDGQKWRNMRNKLTPTFTSGKMKFMFPAVVKVAEQFINVFGEMLEKDNIVEIKELLARFTTDVIGTCAFGIDCNSLQDPNAEFRIMGRRSLTDYRQPRIVMALIQGFPELARKLRMRVVHEDVHQFFMRIVRETLDYRERNNIERNDFINLLMELKNGKNKDFKGLTVEEVAAQAFVFFIAGFETSSSTLGFALYELAQHEEIQQRLRTEIIETLKKHDNEFVYECINEMPYMAQVIAETLRKYPIVPHLNRQALNDYVVPGHPRYVIRKDMPILISVVGLQHDPELYPQPEVFDPERFTAEKVKERESVTWLPFGDGPRNCIGLRFGQMQMRVALTLLLKNFKFSACEQTEIPLKMNKKSFLQNSESGIFLKVERV